MKLGMRQLRILQEKKTLLCRVLFYQVYTDVRNECIKRVGEKDFQEEMVRDLFCIRYNIGFMEHDYRLKLVEYKLTAEKFIERQKNALAA